MENHNTEKPNKIRIEQEALNEAAGKDYQVYDIETSFIYGELINKWEMYNIDFLYNEVLSAIRFVHRVKRVALYYDDGSEHMKSKIKWEVNYFLKQERNSKEFIFSDLYIGFETKYNNQYIVTYNTLCVIRKEDDLYCFDLLFAMQFSLKPINECGNFLQYHYEKTFNKNSTEFSDFLDIICIEYQDILKEKHEPFYRLFIENILGNENELNKNSAIQKLKWLGTPSQFSYFFLQLAEKGFIEIPSTNGEASYSKFSKVCWDLFDFEKTTLENLKKEMNPNKNTLSEGVRAKITIPDLKDISKKKK